MSCPRSATWSISVAFTGTPWGFGVALRLYRDRKAADAAGTADALADQAARNAEAVEAEHARIARDLHDMVSHAMAVTLMQARGGRRVQATDPAAAQAAFEAIEQVNAQALRDMRRMLKVLRQTGGEAEPSPAASIGAVPDLIEHVRATGLVVDVVVTGSADLVPPEIGRCAYRIIQEALTNVIKHADASQAQVRLSYDTSDLDLTVADNGNGQSTQSAGGHALTGIRERVTALGGEMRAGRQDPSGFVVWARLPYRAVR